ncbi:hypothetical protein GIB67_013493 [Kingdonia uniflora]|uniref:RING-type domain-containing protein n=1 Tax=Kingdonia uniflora TaxID=39325 RepID=A0A7J7LRG8_9MAGN|nr:hypothetical protein GIB67_013493 [Kingdonia uniflora]
MGLSNYPSPADGMVVIIVMHTVMYVNIIKSILRSIINLVGINLSQPLDSDEIQIRTSRTRKTDTEVPSTRFESVCENRSELECSVCLTRFEPESEVNSLCCGHVYHKVCLEKWLDYWNVTCPLCRTSIIPEPEDEPIFCFY